MENTKHRILEAALKLFSEEGYEGVGVERIAKEVGIKGPSLYKHYKSKRDIYDSLLEEMNIRYREHSLLIKTDWEDVSEDHSRFAGMTSDDAANKVLEQFDFYLHDPFISRLRKFLTIEQYKNPELAEVLENMVYRDELEYHVGLMKFLIEKKVLKPGDPEVLALEYTAPVMIQLLRVDREPSKEAEARELIRKHIHQFNDFYRVKQE